MAFSEWEAAVAAGATLDELYKWESGGYPRWFRARVIAWHNLSTLIKAHQEEAIARDMRRKKNQKGL